MYTKKRVGSFAPGQPLAQGQPCPRASLSLLFAVTSGGLTNVPCHSVASEATPRFGCSLTQSQRPRGVMSGITPAVGPGQEEPIWPHLTFSGLFEGAAMAVLEIICVAVT